METDASGRATPSQGKLIPQLSRLAPTLDASKAAQLSSRAYEWSAEAGAVDLHVRSRPGFGEACFHYHRFRLFLRAQTFREPVKRPTVFRQPSQILAINFFGLGEAAGTHQIRA